MDLQSARNVLALQKMEDAEILTEDEKNSTMEEDAVGVYLKMGYSRYYLDCNYCLEEMEQGNTFFPTHVPSSRCQSGGRTHCTCDTCF